MPRHRMSLSARRAKKKMSPEVLFFHDVVFKYVIDENINVQGCVIYLLDIIDASLMLAVLLMKDIANVSFPTNDL